MKSEGLETQEVCAFGKRSREKVHTLKAPIAQCGARGSTVSDAALLVAEPMALVTVTLKLDPLSAGITAGVV